MESIIKELGEKRGEKTIEHGDKEIKIEVHFLTNDLATSKEKCIPKVAWDFGTVHILKNDGHGIERSDPIHYSTLSELQATIERAFAERGIRLIHSQKYGTPYYYP